MRSSCEASARNWRRRCSVASRSAKASSISSSMVLRARPSWPTSLAPPDGVTREDRSPPAIVPAVPAICSRGRSPRRRTSQAPAERMASRAAAPNTSMSTRRCRALVTSPMGTAITTVWSPPDEAATDTRQLPEPLADPVVKNRGLVAEPALRWTASRGWAVEVASCTWLRTLSERSRSSP